jgi:hypothetical protein
LGARTTILKSAQSKTRLDLAGAMQDVMDRTGMPVRRLLPDLMRAMLGQRRMKADEYFLQGAWIGGPEERAAFVGGRANLRLNRGLTTTSVLDQWSLMTDKYLAGLILEANGFPVPVLKAGYAADAPFGNLKTLASVEALAEWLSDASNLPGFGKPVDGTMALGSVPLIHAGSGMVDIGGQVVEAVALAREVAALYPRGWLIQEQLRQPPEIEALIGPGIGTVRLVTLWEEAGPQPMYGVWRHPSPGTWVDAAIHGRANVGCALDQDGTVIRAHEGDLLSGREVTHSLISPDLPLVGFRLEQWPAIVAIGCAGHRLFPGHALIGWDVAMTVRGPVISEINANPLHMSYQRAFRRGFLHPEHRARLDEARRLLQERAARYSRKRG